MNIVSGSSIREIQRKIHKEAFERYKPDDTGGMICKKCNKEIQQETGYISIHLDCFDDCVGDGEVKNIAIPYCPECEGKPIRTSTCVHVPFN